MASHARAVAMRCEGVARCTGSYIMLLRKRASLESRLLIWRNISCRQTARNRLVHHGVSAPIFISRRGRWTDVPLYHEVRRRSTIYLDICNNHTFSHLTHVTSLSMKKKNTCVKHRVIDFSLLVTIEQIQIIIYPPEDSLTGKCFSFHLHFVFREKRRAIVFLTRGRQRVFASIHVFFIYSLQPPPLIRPKVNLLSIINLQKSWLNRLLWWNQIIVEKTDFIIENNRNESFLFDFSPTFALLL